MSTFISGLEQGLQTTDWLKVAGVGKDGTLDPWFTKHLLGVGSGGYGAVGTPGEPMPIVQPLSPAVTTTDLRLLSGGGLSTHIVARLTNPATFNGPESLHGVRPWLPYLVTGVGLLAAGVMWSRGRH